MCLAKHADNKRSQLFTDKRRQGRGTVFQLFDERQDVMVLAAVTALLLGCRASGAAEEE